MSFENRGEESLEKVVILMRTAEVIRSPLQTWGQARQEMLPASPGPVAQDQARLGEPRAPYLGPSLLPTGAGAISVSLLNAGCYIKTMARGLVGRN